MNAALGRVLLRMIGLVFETRNPVSLCRNAEGSTQSDKATVSSSDCSSTKWQFERVGLKSGWYMLEVEHAENSIGCVLMLRSYGSDTAYLRLGSKKVCKRIVWFAERVSELVVSIDQPDCSLERLSLIALTSTFAMSRVRQRLENRGSAVSGPTKTVAEVYNYYQSKLHGSVFSKPYRYIEMNDPPAGEVVHRVDGRRASVYLKLRPDESDDRPLCDSLIEAVDYARESGWSVAWQTEVEGIAAGVRRQAKNAYLMPVQSGVRYRPDAIHQLLSAVSDNTVMVYADHDNVEESGQHYDPILKPDWNPELLLNFNYIDLPWIVSESWFGRVTAGLSGGKSSEDMSLLAAALGSQLSLEKVARLNAAPLKQSSQDAFGVVAALTNDQVEHVPEILASKEMRQTALIRNATTKKGDWQRSVQLALDRAEFGADVSGGKIPGFTRVLWPLPADRPAVDVIVPTRDKVGVLKKCLVSVLSRTQYPNFRIIVVDNESIEDETERYYLDLENDERVRLIRYQQPFNYSAINNFAVECTDAPILVLLNNDTEVISSNWLDELVRQALRPGVGCVGAKLYYSNGRIQHAGVVVGITGVAGHAFRYAKKDEDGYCGRLQTSQNYTAVTAACLAIRRETYLKVGGFDQDNLSVAWNDVDFCMKVVALGLRNVWTPYAELFHHEGLSRGSDDTPQKIERMNAERNVMMTRWALNEFKDPAYHPLLTRDNENFFLGDVVT